MKKLFALTLGIIMAAALTACAGGANGVNDAGADTASLGLIENGKLKVGMEISYPPFEYYTDDMTAVGLDVDLANEIAAKLGAEAELVNTDFNAIISGLDANKYDVALSAVTINAERMAAADFSSPYIENWQTIVVKAGSAPVTSMEDLEGRKVGMQDGVTSAEIVDDMIQSGQLTAATQVFLFDSVLNAFEDLKLGRIDCVVTDSTVADGYLEREAGAYEISWHQKDVAGAVAEEFGIAVKKGNTALTEAINKALAELEASGRLDELRDEWLS